MSSNKFGQLVIGPPGSGKTTYCKGVLELLTQFGRKVAVVNIDPANDSLPYDCILDISKLITVEDVMTQYKLGPNGGLIYCMEFLEKNTDWLIGELTKYEDHYIIFDCPGQVELYTHHNSMKNIVQTLEKHNYRLCSVHLVDSHYCSDPGKFVSVLLTSLSSMLQIEMPRVNILSKIDLIEKYEKLQFGIDFYTEVLDLSYLLNQLDARPFTSKYQKLNASLIELIESYGLVSFLPLNIQDKKSLLQIIEAVDKANGYIYGSKERDIQSLLSATSRADFEYIKTADVREKYVAS